VPSRISRLSAPREKKKLEIKRLVVVASPLCKIFLTGRRLPMRSVKFVSFFLFTILCSLSYAHENKCNFVGQNIANVQINDSTQARLEKVKRYIDPRNVRFEQKEMHVQVDQNWVITNAIYTDADGFYVLETKGGWTCGYCSYYNEKNNWTCDNCGKKRE
jgi:hypothetical protein